MVEFTDGATVAQLSLPDMRLPIAYALAWPARAATPFGRIDWAEVGRLDFESPDLEAFPCLALAFAAGRAGGSAPAWLSAANEVAVAAFLEGRLAWSGIAPVLEEALSEHTGTELEDADVVIEVDRRARERTRSIIERRAAA
jgi:1-deoxy-D-xylulose-5-phosphate reductoisomerase